MFQFEFNNQLLPQSLIDIEDIGNFTLEGINDDMYFYYLVVQTEYGISKIYTCGPVVPDVETIPNNFSIAYKKMEFNQDKLCKEIATFLNDKKKSLVKASLVSIETAAKEFRDVREFILEEDSSNE